LAVSRFRPLAFLGNVPGQSAIVQPNHSSQGPGTKELQVWNVLRWKRRYRSTLVETPQPFLNKKTRDLARSTKLQKSGTPGPKRMLSPFSTINQSTINPQSYSSNFVRPSLAIFLSSVLSFAVAAYLSEVI
jgi:hypothetical protein